MTVYMVWIGGPIRRFIIQEHIDQLGFKNLDCTLLGNHFAAMVTGPAEDCERLVQLKFVRIEGLKLIVSDECPLPCSESPKPQSSANLKGLRDMSDLAVSYVFPARQPTTDNESRTQSPALQSPTPSAGPVVFGEGKMTAAFKRRMTFSLYEKQPKSKVFKVCLTGGPCAGKTTTLSTIISKFNAQGIRTYAVPEVATMLINGGLSFTNMTREKVITYQSVILSMQLSIEQHFLDVALADEGLALIISDRGTMDGKAYCDDQTWAEILEQLDLDNVRLRDQQYDAVYHLVTAADGAEEYYGNQTNVARTETPEQAREQDKKTLSVYLGHPYLRIIDNSTDFARKVERVLTSISEKMGVTLPTGVYRRYLVQAPVPTVIPVPTVALDVEIGIVRQPDQEVEARVVARGQDGRCSYFLQELRDVNGKAVITERKLTPDEYHDRKRFLDEDFELIRKKSLTFTYHNQYFELCTIITPQAYSGTALLYIESHVKPNLPPFIPIIREVTDEPGYNNLTVSQTDYNAMDPGMAMASMRSTASTEDGEEEPMPHLRETLSARTLSISLTAANNLQHFSLKSFKSRAAQERRSLGIHGPRLDVPRHSFCSTDSLDAEDTHLAIPSP